MIDYNRQILALDDVELEKLVREWVDKQTNKYKSVKRFAGAGDMGRDVVGFSTEQKHEGEWDNYQCKQYNKSLPTGTSILEIGKIIYYSLQGHFTLPVNYYFVAPKGVNRTLEKYIFNPTEFKNTLINEWDRYCKDKITSSFEIQLTDELRDHIDTFNFSSIKVIDLDTIINDESFKIILIEKFGGELPEEEIEVDVPPQIQSQESTYIKEILAAYSESDKNYYPTYEHIKGHTYFELDFDMQRERFFSTDAFKHLYRDNTFQTHIEKLEKQVFMGIHPSLGSSYEDGYKRMCYVLSQAANISPTGRLSTNANVMVKQGYCHHFVNGGKFKWIKWKFSILM